MVNEMLTENSLFLSFACIRWYSPGKKSGTLYVKYEYSSFSKKTNFNI